MKRTRALVVVAVALVAIATGAPGASAHATFAGPASYPTGTEQRITIDVPHERGDGPYNVGVAMRAADGWTVLACEAQAPWRCAVGQDAGRSVVTWTKDTAAGPTANDEQFTFAMRIGPVGRASFPVEQTYSTGETARWIGPEGSEQPAPVLESVPASGSATTTTVVAATTTTTATQRTTTTTTAPPSTTAVAGAPTTSTTTAADDTDATTTTTEVDDDDESTTTTIIDDETGDDGDSSSPLVPIAIALIVAGVIAAGAAAVVRRRRHVP